LREKLESEIGGELQPKTGRKLCSILISDLGG